MAAAEHGLSVWVKATVARTYLPAWLAHPPTHRLHSPLHNHLAQATARLLAAVDELRASRARVALVGATNRREAVDPALRRAGRLDCEVGGVGWGGVGVLPGGEGAGMADDVSVLV